MLMSTEAGQLGLMAMGGGGGCGGEVTLDIGRSWLEGLAQLSIPGLYWVPQAKGTRPVWEHRALFSHCFLVASVMDYHLCKPGLRATKVTEPMVLLQEKRHTACEPYSAWGRPWPLAWACGRCLPARVP